MTRTGGAARDRPSSTFSKDVSTQKFLYLSKLSSFICRRGKPEPTPQLLVHLRSDPTLPLREQELIIRFLDTILEKAEKSESFSVLYDSGS